MSQQMTEKADPRSTWGSDYMQMPSFNSKLYSEGQVALGAGPGIQG